VWRRLAVALGYRPDEDTAPRILAKGWGRMAERLMEEARSRGIPLREDPVMATLLARVDVDQEIPPILYRAVAEILAFIYALNDKEEKIAS
jgi:flagellar biosynthesis protein